MKSVYDYLTERSAPVATKEDPRIKELHELVTKWGKHNEVKALLEDGVDVDAEDEDGYTPLYNAVKHNAYSYKTIQALLKAGADVYYYSDKNYVEIYLENQTDTDIESIEVILDNFTESGFKKEDMDKAIENASIEVKYHYNRMEYAEELLASNYNKYNVDIIDKTPYSVLLKFNIGYVLDSMWEDEEGITSDIFKKVALSDDELVLLDKNDERQYEGQFFTAYEGLSSELIDMAYKYAKQQGYEGEDPEGEPDTDLGRFLLKDDIAETMIDTYTEHEYYGVHKLLLNKLGDQGANLKDDHITMKFDWEDFTYFANGLYDTVFKGGSIEDLDETGYIEDYHNDMEEVFQKAIKD